MSIDLQNYGNTLDELMEVFGLNINESSHWDEFKLFWESLTDIERIWYRYAKI